MTRDMRVKVRPHGQGSRERTPRSPVLYRMSGKPSLVMVVNTSSPSLPGSATASVAGSMVSTMKWSSFTCSPPRALHSNETPGPRISVSP